jgi:hypothetical protein
MVKILVSYIVFTYLVQEHHHLLSDMEANQGQSMFFWEIQVLLWDGDRPNERTLVRLTNSPSCWQVARLEIVAYNTFCAV